MDNNFTSEELLALGFSSVGNNVIVSRDVRFYSITGSLGDSVRIDTYSVITGDVSLGNHVHIAPLCFLSATGGKISMADGSGMGPQVALLTKSDDYTAPDLTADSKVEGDIVIGANAIIGSGCKILPGVTIGSNVSIGSNCVITSNVKNGDIIVSRGASNLTVGNRHD